MDNMDFDKEKLIKYWIEGSDDDYETMIAMYKSKRFNWSLFIGHLIIEKLIKENFLKIKTDYPPFIHNLLRLAEKSDLDLTERIKEQLATITAFNINARYDDYKMSFKHRCTLEYTSEWIENLKDLRLWMKLKIKQ